MSPAALPRPADLLDVLHHEIPLTRAIEVSVRECSFRRVVLAAPLAPNINHKRTAFGGSLHTLALLAGWSVCWVLVREAGIPAQVVVQENASRYLHPVARDFTAECLRPDPAVAERFLATLRRRRRARLELEAQVRAGSTPAMTFTGTYVALRTP